MIERNKPYLLLQKIAGNFYLRWITAFILLPMASFAAISSFIFYSVPLIIVDYILLGFLALLLPRKIIITLFAILTFYIIITVSSQIFYFTLNSLLESADEIFYNNMAENLKMLAIALGITGIISFIFAKLAPQKPSLNIAKALFLSIIFLGSLSAKKLIKDPTERFNFSLNTMSLYANTPFSRATYEKLFGYQNQDIINETVSASWDIAHLDQESEKNVLLIAFESLGNFKDAEYNEIYKQVFQSDDITKRYTVKTGTIKFHGSTVPGEIRELCDKEYITTDPKNLGNLNCLPEIFNKRDYKTIAVHGFYPDYFNRKNWYNDLNFQQKIYMDDIKETSRLCGVNLVGKCDLDSLNKLSGLIHALPASQKYFAYWMTLETHLHIDDSDLPTKEDCAAFKIKDKDVCHLTKKIGRILSEIAAASLKLRNTKILIVGDHAPHFMFHGQRQYYDYKNVPYIYLEPK